jgi:transcriptional regulator with XRE-family HTH domain
MYWNLGEVYKNLRLDKQISQVYASDGITSRSNLCRIENGEQMPSIDTMHQLLEKLDVTLSEFDYLCQQKAVTKKQQLISDFNRIDWSCELAKLDKLAADCEKYLKSTDDSKVSEILQVISAYKNIHNEGLSSTKNDLISQVIWKRLSKIDSFTVDDLKMLNRILFTFSSEQLDSIVPNIKSAIHQYANYSPIYVTSLNILCNISLLKMKSGEFDEAIDFLQQALPMAKSGKYYDFLSAIWVRLGICTKDENLIQKGMTLIEAADEPAFSQALSAEIESFR